MLLKLVAIVLLAPVVAADFRSVAQRASSFSGLADGFTGALQAPTNFMQMQRPLMRSFRQASASKSDSKYNAMCLMPRDSRFRDDPVLHYFASGQHSAQTLGCSQEKGIDFTLDTDGASEDDQGEAYEEQINKKLLEPKLYDPEVPTFFMTHGFLSSWNGDTWMCELKDSVLNASLANVFIVDWSGGAKPMLPIDYSRAVSNTKVVAQLVGGFVRALLRLSGQKDARLFHLIGHSLGAHISGFIGYALNGTVGRITGLDPAGPCFTSMRGPEEAPSAAENGYLASGSKRRLSAASAKLVVAMHTDCSLFGLNENCGHYDIFVNGGSSQAGCTSLVDIGTKVFDLIDMRSPSASDFDLNLVCAHSYAHQMIDALALVPSSKSTGLLEDASLRDPLRCQPVAFECSSWSAFTAGECGLCRDNKPECIYIGLHLDRLPSEQLVLPAEQSHAESSASEDDKPWTTGGDDSANGELVNAQNSTTNSDVSFLISRGRHFVRSGASIPHCRFHYQVLVAASPSGAHGSQMRHHLYLQLPIDGDRSRLVRVSHAIRQGTPAHSRLLTQLGDTSLFGDPPKTDNVEFYTALITFGSTKNCDGALTDDSDWTLCKPLNKDIEGARIWSSSPERVGRVRWIALNLMSGYSQSDRKKGSALLQVAGSVEARSSLAEARQARLEELRAGKSAGPLDCLVGSVNELSRVVRNPLADTSAESSSDLNSNCDRSESELSHWALLEPARPAV